MTARAPKKRSPSDQRQREPRVRRPVRTAPGKIEPLYPRQKKTVRRGLFLRLYRLFTAVPCVGREQWKQNRRRMDSYIFWVTVILVLFGLAMVYSTTSFVGDDPLAGVKKQAFFALLGLFAMLFLSRLDYHRLLCLSWCQLYFLSFVLLVVTQFRGRSSHGKMRWIKLGPLSFQPSELMKTALVLFFAVYLVNHFYRLSKNPRRIFWTMAFFGGIPALLVAHQNLSTGLLLGAMVFLITFLGVRDNRTHLALAVFMLVTAYFVTHYYKKIPFLHTYQIARIESWLHPEANANGSGFQVRLGKYAISAGGWFGAGFGRGIVKQNGLPEPSTDFIFPVIGEELGMVGMGVLILLYFMLLLCIWRIAFRAPDRYGALICGGVAIHILLHIAMHVAVVTGMMPNTGVTLPFISSGGTSLLSFMGEIGLVLAVSRGVRPEKLI